MQIDMISVRCLVASASFRHTKLLSVASQDQAEHMLGKSANKRLSTVGLTSNVLMHHADEELCMKSRKAHLKLIRVR